MERHIHITKNGAGVNDSRSCSRPGDPTNPGSFLPIKKRQPLARASAGVFSPRSLAVPTNKEQLAAALESGRRNRGFGSMSPELQKQIASMGGKKAHASGNAHQFDQAEAKAAGSLGGQKVSANREHMRAIGKLGGQKSGAKRKVVTPAEGGPQ